MKINKLLIFLIFLLIVVNFRIYAENNIFIAYKVENEVITNIDIKNESKYLMALNKQLKNIDKNKILEMEGIHFKINSSESISITYEKNSLNFGEIINYLSQNNIKILDIITEDGDLEDVFIQLTNR